MRALAPMLAALFAAACGNPLSSDPAAADPLGAWGGDHASLLVKADSSHAEFDCAHGSVAEPLRVDAFGTFGARGTWTREGPGPVRWPDSLYARPARYSGRIIGDVMTLSVVRTDTAVTIGTFALVRGRDARVAKCL